jgi:hypothetical protein
VKDRREVLKDVQARHDWRPAPVVFAPGTPLGEKVNIMKAHKEKIDTALRLEVDRLMRFEHRRRFRSKQRSIRAQSRL